MSVEQGTEATTIQDATSGNALTISASGAAKVDGSAVTQPISGTVAATQSGIWTVQPGNTANTTAWKTDGSAVTQPISAASLPLPTGAATSALQTTGNSSLASIDAGIPAGLGQTTMSASMPIAIASDQSTLIATLGNSTGKTNVLKTGTLVTTATTVDQVILTYTVTGGKTFYLQYCNFTVSFTAAPTNFNTPVLFGNVSLETPSGTKDVTWRMMGPFPQQDDVIIAEPIPIAAGVVIRLVCTPGITTSLTWIGNFGGYEK